MTCTHQSCRQCPHRPAPEIRSAPFDADVATRSMEFAAVRLGMHWTPDSNTELDIAVIPDITELHRCPTATGSCGCRPENNGGIGACGKEIAPIIIGS